MFPRRCFRHSLCTLFAVAAPLLPLTGQVVDFSASPRSGTAPLTVSFRGDADLFGRREWRWDFGDGSGSNDRNPEHTYRDAGVYTVTLTASTRFEGEHTEIKRDLIRVTAPVELDFDASVTAGCAPLTVRFTNRSSVQDGDSGGTGDDSDRDADGWEWDFGDGGTSAERDPTHTYSAGGEYTVRLRWGGAEEVRRDLIRVDDVDEPDVPRYDDIATVGDVITVRWDPSRDADRHGLERQIDAGPWTAVCSRDGDGDDDLECDVVMDRAGTWRIRAVASGDCGAVSSPPGDPLEVRPRDGPPPPPRLFWPLDDCSATESEARLDGSFVGDVTCGEADRFGAAERSLEFSRSGLVLVPGLPRRTGPLTIALWFRGDDAGEQNSTIFELATAGRDNVLRLRWERGDGTVRFEHGDAEIAASGVADGEWHHLVLTRVDGVMRLYVDGVLNGAAEHDLVPGDVLALGGRIDDDDQLTGGLDDVLYDDVGRNEAQVRELLREGGPTVLLGSSAARELSAEGGHRAEVLRLRLQAGESRLSGGHRLERLRVSAIDLDASRRESSSSDAARALEAIERLVLRSAGESRDLGEFEVVDASSAHAIYSWTSRRGGEPLPSGVFSEFVVEAIAADLPDSSPIRVAFELLSTADVEVYDGATPSLVVAEAASMPIAGNTVYVLRSAPRLYAARPSMPARLVETGDVADAELLSVRLEAGTVEDVRVDTIVLRAAGGTTLDGASEFRLEVDGERVSADTTLGDDARELRLADLDIDIPAGREIELTFRAHLDPPEPAAVVAGAIRGALAPLVAAPLAVCLVVLASLRLRARATRGGPLVLALLLLSASVGCGPAVIGGLAAGLASSGGGGGGGSTAAVARYQVVLDPRVDVSARGRATSAPVILESPPGVIEGPVFEIRGDAR